MNVELKKKLVSKFVVLDGPDGCGKSTQLKLLADQLNVEGLQVTSVRDPGTTAAGEAIRDILLSGKYGRLSPRCELLLFMAARAQMISEIIHPAIEMGRLVLGDRFISASLAYQGASGVDLSAIIEMGKFAVHTTWPNLTIILDVPVELGLQRIHRKNHLNKTPVALDAMECRSIEFHRRVRETFLRLPGIYPGRVEIIDASSSIDQVHEKIVEALGRVDS